MTIAKVNGFWSPRVVVEINGHYVKLAKVKGEMVWHTHDNEYSFFRSHLVS